MLAQPIRAAVALEPAVEEAAGSPRTELGRFAPGYSGNPGRPRRRTLELTALLASTIPRKQLAAELIRIALKGEKETDRLAALKYIYDRIDGTPTQRIEFTVDDARRYARELAEEEGIDPDVVEAEFVRIVGSSPE